MGLFYFYFFIVLIEHPNRKTEIANMAETDNSISDVGYGFDNVHFVVVQRHLFFERSVDGNVLYTEANRIELVDEGRAVHHVGVRAVHKFV